MRKLFLFLLVVLFNCSCVTWNYEVNVSTIDYAKLSNSKGFFISESNSVSFEYTPIGSISIECVSGNDGVESELNWSTTKYKHASIEDGFKKLIQVSIEKGANGVINVQTKYLPAFNTKYAYYPDRIIVSGMMIKK